MQGRRRLQPSDTNSPNPFPTAPSLCGEGADKDTRQESRRNGGRACIREAARSRPRDPSSERVRPLAHDAAPPHARRASPRLPSCTPPPRPQPRRMRSRRPHNAAGARRKPYPPRRTAHRRLKAATAGGLHLFPFRTEKLNPRAPMILRKRESRSPPPPRAPESNSSPGRSFLSPAAPMALRTLRSYKSYKSYKYTAGMRTCRGMSLHILRY